MKKNISQKISLLAMVVLMITSCAKQEQQSIFAVSNNGSLPINIDYHSNQTDSNIFVTIPQYQSLPIFINDQTNGDGYNWYFDYSINIQLITNSAGDTLNFNPNVVHYWQREVITGKIYYNLFINDYCF